MAELPLLRDLVVLLLLSLGIVLAFQRLRQPPVVGFLAAGVVLGPHGLSLVRDPGNVERLAEVGVILLLFTLGLEFSLAALAQLWRQLLVGGGVQAVLTTLLGAALALAVTGWREALLIGALVALSSTVITLRVLMDRGEVDAAHGRAVVGILLLQDLLVIPMMLGVQFLADGGAGAARMGPGRLLGALGLVAAILLAARWGIPHLLAAVVRTRRRELFVLTLVLICLGTAWVTSRAGLSLALGAFLAGVAVSESEYGAQALADVIPLRDTFSSLFFISIGMLFDVGIVARQPLLLAGAVVAVLALKVVTGTVAGRALGLGLRTAVLAGFAVAQVGEFSFVLAGAGLQVGLLGPERYQLFLGVAVATMFATPFLFVAAEAVAERLARAPLPAWLAGRPAPAPLPAPEGLVDHVVIGGYGLNGANLARVLREVGIAYVVVDVNPERVWEGRARGEPIVYGDLTRYEVLERLALERARALVVAISDPPATRRVVTVARTAWPHLAILVRTRYLSEVEMLYRLGASEVVPEELETSIEIFAKVLETYEVPRALIAQQVDQVRREHYAVWLEKEPPGYRRARLGALLAGLDVDTYVVTEVSHAAGRTLGELDLRGQAGVTVIARVRDGVAQPGPAPDAPVEPGDTLVLFGTNPQVERALALLETGQLPGD